jgi:hypothetical protein
MCRYARRPVALFVLLLVLGACDTVEGDEATFTATLAGAVDAQLEGEATFGSVFEAGESRFRIFLQADENLSGGTRGSIGFFFEDEDRPTTDTYAVGSVGGVAVTIVLVDAQGAPSLVGVSGTLVIAESSAERLSGSFDFEAETVFGGGETTVSGTFTAVPA